MKKFNTPNHGNEDDQIKNYEMKVHKLWASENRCPQYKLIQQTENIAH